MQAVERAASAALADLDSLIGSAEAANLTVSDDLPAARRAELG